jgi:hypothetical protein
MDLVTNAVCQPFSIRGYLGSTDEIVHCEPVAHREDVWMFIAGACDKAATSQNERSDGYCVQIPAVANRKSISQIHVVARAESR